MTEGRRRDLAAGPHQPSLLLLLLILSRTVMADHDASSPHFCFTKSQEAGELI